MTRSNARRAGFTLIELMVAMIAGSITVAGVYYLNGVSSRTFSEQMRVSDMQMSLRSAMEQVRRDLSRAGYLASSNSRLLPNCEGTPEPAEPSEVASRWIRALEIERNGSPVDARGVLGIAPDNLNRTRADRVRIWGNFTTSDMYLLESAADTSTTLRFQTDRESFRRSFFIPNPDPADTTPDQFDSARFRRAFEEQVVRLEHQGRTFFRDVVAIDTSFPPSITVDSLPTNCFDKMAMTTIAPVSSLEYRLETPDIDEFKKLRLSGNGSTLGRARTMLVRRELDREGDPIDGATRVVLDYAVEFSLAALVDEAVAPALPVWGLRRTAAELTNISQNSPQSFRSLIVTLSSRSVDADPRLPWVVRAPFDLNGSMDGPMMTFQMSDPAAPGVGFRSRVRTLRSELFLQNL